MEIESLIKAHFRGSVGGEFIAGWQARGIGTLLPFQERVARAFAVEAARGATATGDWRSGSNGRMGRNVLISAPTSAGKTLLAEIEIARHLTAGRRAAYLVPTRALAEQKCAEFSRWLAGTGLRVVCATRDRAESDRAVGAGEFDLLVAVYEKMNHYLIAMPMAVAGMGVVVADEIQMLGDRERGGLLDLLLTKMRLGSSPPRIMAISAVINRTTASRLAAWLDAEVHEDSARPLDLREGVLDVATGLFTYKDGRSGEEAMEWLAPPEELERHAQGASEAAAELTGAGDPASVALVGAAAMLARRGEQVLVFAPTRRAARQWAEWLGEIEGGFDPARVALPRLRTMEPGATRERLERCMERGVAFHHGDLDEASRRVVEEAFNAGELRAVVATPTLAMGVNLSARNVLHCAWRYCGGENGGRMSRAPLGRARFSNQGGRAARMGMIADFGRSILVAQSKAEAQRLWSAFVEAEPESLDAPLAAAHLPAIAIDLIAGGMGCSAESLAGAIAETFSSREWRARSGTAGADWLDAEEVRARLGLLAQAEFIRPVPAAGGLRAGETRWMLTGFGEVAAKTGLVPEVAMELRQWLERHAAGMLREDAAGEERSGWIEAMFELALTSEGRRARAGLGLEAWSGLEMQTFDEGEGEADDVTNFSRLKGRRGGFNRDESAALRTALALRAWVAGVSAEELESRFRICCGSLARAAEEFEWLLRAASAIALFAGISADDAARLGRIAERVRFGLPKRLIPLAAKQIDGLGRSAILCLGEMGFGSAKLVAEASHDELVEAVGLDLAEAIGRALPPRGAQSVTRDEEKEEESQRVIATPAVVKDDPSVLIEINLQSPGVIRARGREVVLPPTSFDLLALLAERAGEVVTREAIYQRLWPEGGPEPQQIDGHRRTLIKRLEPAIPREAATIAEVIRGIGMRMALPSRQISLRR